MSTKELVGSGAAGANLAGRESCYLPTYWTSAGGLGEGKCHQYLEGLMLPINQHVGRPSTVPQPYYPSSSILFPLTKVVSK